MRRLARDNVLPLFPELRARCAQCACPMTMGLHGRRKEYCSPKCRKRAYRDRIQEETRAFARGELVLMPKWSADQEEEK